MLLMVKQAMTVNVEQDVLEQFRALVAKIYGGNKGTLGKAISESMLLWMNKQTNNYEKGARALMRKGAHLGGFTYSKRDELYD
ncbi:hypothetical protein COS70_01615 [Candidatus Micrarchaeota archaeon CG06_land_8_20_14_3_00_50_6]|nr:MAG: hypothetical protein COS70_01615 [Candidatus Micrarchaeota archaeon CG06_land_8_20_14_3_00_50_6]